jgi:hypothetical protein
LVEGKQDSAGALCRACIGRTSGFVFYSFVPSFVFSFFFLLLPLVCKVLCNGPS